MDSVRNFSIILLVSVIAVADDDNIPMYQVGRNGKYCLSITKDESGCVSGVKSNGEAINRLDFLKGKTVTFENLSDAYHDMRIAGNNAQNFPPQAPNAAAVQKPMLIKDLLERKITCSFHGDQLGLGYRVPELEDPNGGEPLDGHRDAMKMANMFGGSGAGLTGEMMVNSGGGQKPVVNTGLADVSGEVLKKGRPEEVGSLVSARPELMAMLEEVRPLLASEIAMNMKNYQKGELTVGNRTDKTVAQGSASYGNASGGVASGEKGPDGSEVEDGGSAGNRRQTGVGTAEGSGQGRAVLGNRSTYAGLVFTDINDPSRMGVSGRTAFNQKTTNSKISAALSSVIGGGEGASGEVESDRVKMKTIASDRLARKKKMVLSLALILMLTGFFVMVGKSRKSKPHVAPIPKRLSA